MTAAGSLGLLFPPSLPVILYSVVASTREPDVPADLLYLAGLVPGLLLVLLVAVYGIRVGLRRRPRRASAFVAREAAAAAWAAKWELALPVFVVVPVRQRHRLDGRDRRGRAAATRSWSSASSPATSTRCASCPACCVKAGGAGAARC